MTKERASLFARPVPAASACRIRRFSFAARALSGGRSYTFDDVRNPDSCLKPFRQPAPAVRRAWRARSRAACAPPACCRRWPPARLDGQRSTPRPAPPAAAGWAGDVMPAAACSRNRLRRRRHALDAGVAQHLERAGRSSMLLASLRIAACSSTLRSSRMLPRQCCAASSASASGVSSNGACRCASRCLRPAPRPAPGCRRGARAAAAPIGSTLSR
jgi:hypothetical protein